MHGTFEAAPDEMVVRRPQGNLRGDAVALLRRNLGILVLATVVGAGLGYAIARNLPPRYVAAARLVLERNDSVVSQPTAAIEQLGLDRSAVETEMDVIHSRSFGGDGVDKFGLMTDPDFNSYLAPDTGGLVGKILRLLPPSIAKQLGVEEPELELPPVAVQRDRAITKLLQSMKVSRVSAESLAMDLSVNAADPVKAARLANGLATLYVDASLERKRDAVMNTITFLHDRSEAISADISSDEIAQSKFGALHRLSNDQNVDLLRGQMIELNQQLTLARVQLSESEARLKQAQIAVGQGSDAFNSVVNSVLLATLQSDRSTLQRELQLLPPRHPARTGKQQELATLEDMIRSESDRILGELGNQVELSQQQADKLQADLDKLDAYNREREIAQVQLEGMGRQINDKRVRQEEIISRLGLLERQGERLQPSARIVSTAEVPIKPVFPRPALIVAGGAAGSAALTVMLILVLAGFDNRVRAAGAVEQRCGIASLGYVPRIARGRGIAGLFGFVRKRPRSQIDEIVRAILWRCRTRGGRTQKKVLMITSSGAGEGKSSVASTLAAVGARLGFATALVDFDLRRHGATRMTSGKRRHRGLFGRARQHAPSLQDYLDAGCDIDTLCEPDAEIPNLTIIASSCGALDSNAIFYSDRIESLFAELRARFDLVIVDTPPALLVNEAVELAAHADLVILVARWGQTRIDEFAACSEQFRDRRLDEIGFVLNDVPFGQQKLYELPGAAVDYGRLARGYYRS